MISFVGQQYDRIKMRVKIVCGGGLRAKVFRGGAWLGAGSLTEQVVRFGRNMLLTRLLAPEAFGTMAIALSSASIVDTLLEAGVRQAIIQNPRGGEKRYLNAAWWLAMGRGLAFYILIFAAAPLIAKFYGNAILSPVLRVALLSVIFESAMSPGANLAIKQMKFSKWALINHGGAVCGVVLTLILSFFLPGVWALAIGYAAENAGRCLLSYVICPLFPSVVIARDAVRDLLSFSRGVFGLAFLNLIFLRTDVFVLAKLYPAASLGLYVMAVYLVQTPATFLMNLQGQTLLPMFSQIQEDDSRVNRVLLQVTSAIMLLGMPAMVFVFFCGHSVLRIAYGHQYSSATSSFIVASLASLISVINGQLTLVFFAKGLPQLHRRSVAITAFAMVALIYPLTKQFGFMGAQLAAVVAMALGYVFQVARMRQLTGLGIAAYTRTFLVAASFSVLVLAVCFGAMPFALFSHPLPNVMVGVTACGFAYYLAGSRLLRRNFKEVT
jgi:lipopolysaccharide exporter